MDIIYYNTNTYNLLQYVQPEAAITVSEFLMMGGVSPKTC